MTIRPIILSVPSSAARHTMLIVCFVSRRISVSTSSASGSSLRSQVASLSRARTLSTLPISQEISIPARHPTRPSRDIRSLPVCINPVSEGGPKQRVDTLIKIGQWYTIEIPLKIPFNTIQWYLLVIRPTVF